MIKQGDRVRIKPEWRDPCDDLLDWFALENEDGERVKVRVFLDGWAYPVIQVIPVNMLETTP